MNSEFNIKENPVVGFVNANGETRLAIANGVNPETGNPDLAVIQQVPNATHDQSGTTSGTWRYLSEAEIAELQGPVVVAVPLEELEAETIDETEPQSEEPSEPA